MLREEVAITADEFQEQVQRVLSSQGFHGAEVLRRLLQYLADKSISGTLDHLKEYTVAVEGMGKPPSYDPQKSSSVRIQAGRLRQKLTEYYISVGKDDPILIELAKGSFHLTARPRTTEPEEIAPIFEGEAFVPELPGAVKQSPGRFFSPNFFMGLLAGCMLFVSGWALTRIEFSHPTDAAQASPWTPALRELWGPIVESKQPLIVSIEDPLFFEFQSHPSIFFRNRSMNAWDNWQKSTELRTIAMEHTNAAVQPSRYFTTFGEVEASLLLGRLLGPRVQILSLSRSSELTWNQMANNDVLFVGVQYSFFKQIKYLPIELQLDPTSKGVLDSTPAPGQPVSYLDEYATNVNQQSVVYSLVSRLPGPSGLTEVESFTSNRSAGYVAAVQWFTDPDSAKALVTKLKDIGGGKIPRYYQVLLRVTSKDGVPTDVSYVLGRALH